MKMLLTANKVTYRIQQQALVTELSLNLPRGQLWGILGPNGAGKTTLLRLLAGTLSPTEGQVQLEQMPLSQWSRPRLAQWMAMVSPREGVPAFAMTVQQYVLLGRTPYQNWLGTANHQDMQIAEAAIQACGLFDLHTHLVQHLSSGEWQKAQLARALTQQPKLLFLDEPTAHLDLQAQLTLLTLLQNSVQERGLSVVMVLHDLNLASYFCSHLLLLQQGHLVIQGPPSEVLQSHYLQQVYGPGWDVQLNQATGKPYVFPVGIRSH